MIGASLAFCVVALLLLVSQLASATFNFTSNCTRHFVNNDPTVPHQWPGSTELCRDGYYAISYDHTMVNPSWAAYTVSQAEAQAAVGGRLSFVLDPDLKGEPSLVQASSSSDAYNSTWNKGHLCPSKLLSFNPVAQKATYTMSNVAPQYWAFNQQEWRLLEEDVFDWIHANRSLYIITGVAYRTRLNPPRNPADNVAFPQYFYKVICDPVEGESVGWIADNDDAAAGSKDMRCVADVESIVGGTLFPKSWCRTDAEVSRTHWFQGYNVNACATSSVASTNTTLPPPTTTVAPPMTTTDPPSTTTGAASTSTAVPPTTTTVASTTTSAPVVTSVQPSTTAAPPPSTASPIVVTSSANTTAAPVAGSSAPPSTTTAVTSSPSQPSTTAVAAGAQNSTTSAPLSSTSATTLVPGALPATAAPTFAPGELDDEIFTLHFRLGGSQYGSMLSDNLKRQQLQAAVETDTRVLLQITDTSRVRAKSLTEGSLIVEMEVSPRSSSTNTDRQVTLQDALALMSSKLGQGDWLAATKQVYAAESSSAADLDAIVLTNQPMGVGASRGSSGGGATPSPNANSSSSSSSGCGFACGVMITISLLVVVVIVVSLVLVCCCMGKSEKADLGEEQEDSEQQQQAGSPRPPTAQPQHHQGQNYYASNQHNNDNEPYPKNQV